jgi:hypothetical protein
VLIVEDLCLDYFIVVVCAKLAPGIVLHLIVEAFAHNYNVGVFTHGPRVRIDV